MPHFAQFRDAVIAFDEIHESRGFFKMSRLFSLTRMTRLWPSHHFRDMMALRKSLNLQFSQIGDGPR